MNSDTVENQIDEIIAAELCKRSYYEFFKEFWYEIEAVELSESWHLKYLCDELQGIYETWKAGLSQDDVIINVPPGTSKSSVVTKLFPAWLWANQPSIKVLSASYSGDLATAHAMKSRDAMKSEKYKRFYGHLFSFKADKDNKTSYANDKTGERMATGITGTATGFHADFLLFDDPINALMASSEKERTTANKLLSETFSTRKTDKERSVSVLVMQRLHENDPTGAWASKKSVKHICLPGEYGDNIQPSYLGDKYVDGLLDPIRLSRKVLSKMKTDLGSYGYAGQVLQRPAPEEGGLLKKAWFKRFSLSEISSDAIWNFVSDTAYTADKRNDPSGILAYTFHNNNFYIRHWEEMYLEFPDLVKAIPATVQSHGYTNRSQIMVEPKATGKSLVQTLKRETGLNIIEDVPPNKDKVARAMDISAVIESGRVYLLDSSNWIEAFLTQVAQFPNAAHDEVVDMLGIMINRHTNNKKILAFTVASR